jgi:hypothetical protein
MWLCIVKLGKVMNQLDATHIGVYSVFFSSIRFGQQYAHHQDHNIADYRVWCPALLLPPEVEWSWAASCVHCAVHCTSSSAPLDLTRQYLITLPKVSLHSKRPTQFSLKFLNIESFCLLMLMLCRAVLYAQEISKNSARTRKTAKWYFLNASSWREVRSFETLVTVMPPYPRIIRSKTYVLNFSFNALRIKGIYIFRVLLAHLQEALHKRHFVHCVRVMSAGCGRLCSTSWGWASNARNM